MAPKVVAKKAVKKIAKKVVKKVTKKPKMTKAEMKAKKMAKKKAGKAAMKATGKKNAALMKKKGLGIFAPKTLSADLAAICGKKTMPRTEVTKSIWAYIKKNKLNAGRIISPDATLKKVFPVAKLDMLKMAGMLSKHIK